MRARLVRMEPGYRGRQRIVIEIAGDFREQFDQLQGALLEVQITRAIPRRSLASNNYFHALVSRIASTVWGEFDEIKSDLVVEYGTPCLDKAGQVVMVDLPEGTDPHSYKPSCPPGGPREVVQCSDLISVPTTATLKTWSF